MKGIITNIKRMAVHDGHGLRTTVFFKGCPLRCVWCHNPDTLSFKKQLGYFPHLCTECGACVEACPTGALSSPTDYTEEKCTLCGKCADACPISARVLFGEEWDAEALAKKILADRDFFEASGGGVTLSGGECLSQIDFAVELAKIFFDEGISVEIDTTGAVSFDAISRILPYTDEFYKRDFVLKRAKSDLNEKELQRFKREFEEMQSLHSPYIVEVYSYNEAKHEYIMELMDFTLEKYISKNNPSMTLQERKNIIMHNILQR